MFLVFSCMFIVLPCIFQYFPSKKSFKAVPNSLAYYFSLFPPLASPPRAGEIGVFLQGNNDVTPWRFKNRAADLNNLQILPHILKGAKVADIMAVLGSIDVIMGSVDR